MVLVRVWEKSEVENSIVRAANRKTALSI